MERVLTQLVGKLTKAYGSRLKSVILYGSAAVGDHHGRFSDLNVLCVLTQVTPRELADSNAIVRWWRELGSPSPLLMSEEEIRTSTDCFPIEFYDIKERRRVLHGEDVFADLAIETCFHRAQVEHELRAKLLRLRQKAAAVIEDKQMLRKLMAESLSTFCVLFRHALLLAGETAPFPKREIVSQVRERFGIDEAPLIALLELREDKVKARDIEPVSLFASYVKQIELVTSIVDRMEK
jgi:predicted nucleotidyltransferase